MFYLVDITTPSNCTGFFIKIPLWNKKQWALCIPKLLNTKCLIF